MRPLADLADDTSGIIHEIAGGHATGEKLNAMGIRPGMRVKKVCNMQGRGPVVMVCGRTQVAIGRRMAEKILVREDNEHPGIG